MTGQENKDYVNKTPFFRAQTVRGEDRIKITHLGNLDHDQDLIDEEVELSQNIGMGVVDTYSTYCKVYKCNITLSGLVQKIPLMYLSVTYERKIISGSLFSIYCYVTLDDESFKRLKSVKSFDGLKFDGKMSIEMECDKELLDSLSAQQREHLSSLISPVELDNFIGTKYILKRHFIKLAKDPKFLEFAKLCLEFRDAERRTRYGQFAFTPNTQSVISIRELRKNKSLINNMIGKN